MALIKSDYDAIRDNNQISFCGAAGCFYLYCYCTKVERELKPLLWEKDFFSRHHVEMSKLEVHSACKVSMVPTRCFCNG